MAGWQHPTRIPLSFPPPTSIFLNSMGGGEGGGEGGGDPLWRKREAGQDVGMVKMRCGEECGSVSHAARPFRDCDGRGGDIGRDGSGRGAVNASVAPSASEDSSVTAGSCPSAVKPGSAGRGRWSVFTRRLSRSLTGATRNSAVNFIIYDASSWKFFPTVSEEASESL